MKKVFALVSIVVLAFGLVGCGDSKETSQKESSQSEQSQSGDNIATQSVKQDEPKSQSFESEPLCEKVNRSGVLGALDLNTESRSLLKLTSGINILDFKMTPQQIDDLTLSVLGANVYFMGIKRNSKESLCVYTPTFDYFKTEISEEELLRFEQFLAQNKWYFQYEQSKSKFLHIYKFLKYNNKIEEMYRRGGDYFADIHLSMGNYLDKNAIQRIRLGRMVLGVLQGSSEVSNVAEMETIIKNIIDSCSGEDYKAVCENEGSENCKVRKEYCKNEADRDIKEFKAIIAWAKSVNEGKEQRSEVLSSTQNTQKPTTNESATNSTENSTSVDSNANAENLANSSTNLPIIKLATKDDYVNLRKAPSGEIITPIYKKDFEAISLKKVGESGKWIKVLYFPPNKTDEKDAITGYIHISQIAK